MQQYCNGHGSWNSFWASIIAIAIFTYYSDHHHSHFHSRGSNQHIENDRKCPAICRNVLIIYRKQMESKWLELNLLHAWLNIWRCSLNRDVMWEGADVEFRFIGHWFAGNSRYYGKYYCLKYAFEYRQKKDIIHLFLEIRFSRIYAGLYHVICYHEFIDIFSGCLLICLSFCLLIYLYVYLFSCLSVCIISCLIISACLFSVSSPHTREAFILP